MLRRPTRCILLALSALLLFCPWALAQESDVTAESNPRIDRAIQKVWWNQEEKITTLALTPELRQQADQLLRAQLLEAQRGPNRAAFMKTLAEKMVAGEWDAAQASLDEVVEATVIPTRSQIQLMIDVMQLLDADQRKLLAESYPRMLKRPWVRLARSGNGGGRAAGPAGGPRLQD